MSVTVTINLPEDLERQLRQHPANLEADAREALAVKLFRDGKLNHVQLSRVLGLDRFQTDTLLARYQVDEQSLTLADVEVDRSTLQQFLDKA